MKKLIALLQVMLIVTASFVTFIGIINNAVALEDSNKMYILNNKGDIFTEIPKTVFNDDYLKENWYMRLYWGNMSPVDNAAVFVDVLAENGSSLLGGLIPVYITYEGYFPLPPETKLPNARYLVIKKVVYDSLTYEPYPSSFYLPDEDNKPPVITFISPANETIIKPGETLDILIDVQENFLIESVELYVKKGDFGHESPVPIQKMGPNTYKAAYVPTDTGKYYLIAVARDYYNNTNETVLEFLVTDKGDTYPIKIESFGPEGKHKNNKPLIFFNYSEDLGAKVMRVTINGIPITELSNWRMSLYKYYEVMVNNTKVGVYKIALEPLNELEDGEYIFYVYLEDYGGNIATATWSYVVDTTGPPVMYTVENAIMPPWATYYFTSGSINLTLVSPSEDCVMFKYAIDGNEWVEVEAPYGYAKVVIDLTQLSEGYHEVKIVGVDDLGNVGPASNFTVFYDATKPRAIPETQYYRTNSTTVALNVTFEDNTYLGSYEVYKYNELISKGTFVEAVSREVITVKEENLEEGIYAYKVVIRDIAGNVNETTFIVEVDTTGPSVNIIEPKSGSLYGKNDMPIILKVNSSDSDISYYEYSLDGGITWKKFYGETELNLPEGEYVLLVRGVDTLGNKGDPVEVMFKVDLTPPVIGNISIENTTVRINVTDEFSGVANFEVKVDGNVINATYNEEGYIEFEASYGSHTIYIRVYDAAGNVAEKIFNIEISQPPSPPESETTLTAEFNPSTISLGETSNLTIVTGTLTRGLSGCEITVSIDDPDTARIEEVILPNWALYEITNQTESEVTVKVLDINDHITPGSTNVELLTLKIVGLSQGITGVSIEVHKMDDDNGSPVGISAIYTNNLVVDPTNLGVTPEGINITVGSTMKMVIYADHLPEGLSEYTLKIRLTSTVAKIVKVEIPSWASLTNVSVLSAYEVKISVVDLNDTVKPGVTNVTLAIIYIEGITQGDLRIELSEYSLDNDEGNAVPIVLDESFNTNFFVISIQPLPGCVSPPNDLDNDGLYEDVNGNGRLDFNDAVLLFKYMEWVIENNYEKYFDFNRNGRLDFNDAVLLFKMI